MKKIALLFLFFGHLVYSQQDFPAVNVKNLAGETISTASFNEKDKLYVFSFWATWCSPCIQELEAINEVYEDWKTQLNIEVIAVATDDSRTQKRVKPLVNGKGWNYTILLDANQDLKRIHESHDGIIHIIPVISKSATDDENAAVKVNLEQDIQGLFKDFFISKYKQEPNDEILDLFKEVQGATNKN